MQQENPGHQERFHEVSVVVPVYQGEQTLKALVAEIAKLTTSQTTPNGSNFRVAELLLVHDGAVDRSDDVMKDLTSTYPFVHCIWLSRNYGQHPATVAGMASTVSEWVVTLDEDGQQNPYEIGNMLDVAVAHGARLVYGRPVNQPPHGYVRNTLSHLTKWFFTRVLRSRLGVFNSYRLIEGEVARGVAAYCGVNVYLDVALSWVVGTAQHCPVVLRRERGRPSGYTLRRLLRHFWQLVLTSGTFPLRLIALLGVVSIVAAILVSGVVMWQRLRHKIPVEGWTSLFIVTCLFEGLVLVSLGVIAEYLGVAVSMAMGKPPYLIVSRPTQNETHKQ